MEAPVDGAVLPGSMAAGFILATGGDPSAPQHVLGLMGTKGTPPLAPGSYPFLLTSSTGDLTGYFAKFGTGNPYATQIAAEIAGATPFFYLKYDKTAGVYSLVDGFRTALGISPGNLTIDDDYPVGTYTYNGTLTGTNKATFNVTIVLIVVRAVEHSIGSGRPRGRAEPTNPLGLNGTSQPAGRPGPPGGLPPPRLRTGRSASFG